MQNYNEKLKFVLETLKKNSPEEYSEVYFFSGLPLNKEDISLFREIFGEKIIISQSIDPTLYTGFKVRYGNLEIDSTLNAELLSLKSSINSKSKKNKTISHDDFDPISSIKNAIENYKKEYKPLEIGYVLSVKDGVCFVSGLDNCMYQELVFFPEKQVYGIVLNLDTNSVGIVILDDSQKIQVGDKVQRTKDVASVGVGESLIGRVIDPLGNPKDELGSIEFESKYPIERIAPGVITRRPVNKPLKTGIKAIDSMIPIGRGQRELILGDRQTGKTSIAIDTIINQKSQDVICIYVAIGQRESKVVKIVEDLKIFGAMEYTIVVSTSASDSASKQYIAPYSATSIAEYFAEKGKDVLIIYDDLSKHAVAYRELSLLIKRPPGREAYPGDVFYLHSRLLERACCLSPEYGGGSITALPIIETLAGDISAYIPTNVISITDGQIFLETDLFYKGVRPAINVGLSVSRVGSSAQTKPMKKVSGFLKLYLAQYRELEAFAQFSSDLDQETKAILDKGKRIIEILKQKNLDPWIEVDQILSIFAVTNDAYADVPYNQIQNYDLEFRNYVKSNYIDLIDSISKGDWSSEIENKLKLVVQEFRNAKSQSSQTED